MGQMGKTPAGVNGKAKPGADTPDRALRGLTDVFKSLADKSRLQILLMLARDGEMNVTNIGEELGQSQPAVSHHLNQLKKAGLIDYRRDGKFNYYRLDPEGLDPLVRELFTADAPAKLGFGALDVVFKRK